ncbi:antA/AntB antirepressor family protein, partial [Escherichia coli]|nr:antA/AntB antirepressor family protein [Escherichia coli]
MTNQLIPVFDGTINNEPVLLCNARNLHAFLGIGKMFAHWIKDRLGEYGFVENQDVVIACQNWQAKGRGGHNRKEYHLTLDTAKELAMVERNEKGRQIRRYFIECEKKLRNIQPVQTEQQFTAEEIILLCYMQLWMEKAQDLSKHLYPI